MPSMHAAAPFKVSGNEVSAILVTIEWEFERMRRPGVSERGAHELPRRSCMCWSVQSHSAATVTVLPNLKS